jgi:hypothetical protein
VTARDEAIGDIAHIIWHQAISYVPLGESEKIAARVVDDIPADVLVRLAIERGALVEADVYDAEDMARGAPGSLYRTVES